MWPIYHSFIPGTKIYFSFFILWLLRKEKQKIYKGEIEYNGEVRRWNF